VDLTALKKEETRLTSLETGDWCKRILLDMKRDFTPHDALGRVH
jgi:hypothetical protein